MAKNKREQRLYKVICDDLNLVLLLRQLTIKEEQDAYLQLKARLSNLDSPITIESYMEYVLSLLLHKSDVFFSKIPGKTKDDDHEERRNIIRAAYECVIQAYPPFDIYYVCADLNNSALMEEFLDDVDFRDAMFERRLGTGTAKQMRTLSDVQGIEKHIRKNLFGQEEAVEHVVKALKLIASGLYKNSSFFFIGPTGVGKTELARLLGDRYSGKFWKINCAEYANKHEYAKLIGSPPGYIGHTDESLISQKAKETNRWIILLDEIEKADPKFFDFFLSLLDDGTCSDNMGRELDFSETIFIFTSNQGVRDVRVGDRIGFGDEQVTVANSRDEIMQSVKDNFAPEFLNRIDNFVFFNSLTRDDVRDIAKLALSDLPVKKHKCLIEHIVDNGYSEEYGARNIQRFVKNEVAIVIANALLDKKLPKKKGDLYTPKIKNGKFVLGNLKEEEEKENRATA